MSTPVVLITGALTGIGRATAIAFAKEGGTVGCLQGRTGSLKERRFAAELRELEYWRQSSSLPMSGTNKI